MRHRPTICFDTSVCIKAADGTYPRSEWRNVVRFVVSKFDYAIVPPVFTELVMGIARGTDSFFEQNQAGVKILYPTRKKRFLPPPGYFLLEKILGYHIPKHASYASRFEREARTIVLAKSRRDLVSANVLLPRGRKYSIGMDLDMIRNQMDAGQQAHVDSLERLRKGELAAHSVPWKWVKGMLRPLKDDLSQEECERLASVLDAAFRYDCYLWNEASGGRYDFSKHRSDWIDSSLLLYLADPHINLLVHDRKLKMRIAGSPQSDRVHNYDEFALLAGGCVTPA
jgi:hypothetical protein